MLFGDPVETGKHDRQDDTRVLLNQTHDVLIVPVVQGSFCHLKQYPNSILNYLNIVISVEFYIGISGCSTWSFRLHWKYTLKLANESRVDFVWAKYVLFYI